MGLTHQKHRDEQLHGNEQLKPARRRKRSIQEVREIVGQMLTKDREIEIPCPNKTERRQEGRSERGRGKKTLQPSFPILQLRTKLDSRSLGTQQSTLHNGQSLFYLLSYILGIHIYIYIYFAIADGVAGPNIPFKVAKTPGEKVSRRPSNVLVRTFSIGHHFLSIPWEYLIAADGILRLLLSSFHRSTVG